MATTDGPLPNPIEPNGPGSRAPLCQADRDGKRAWTLPATSNGTFALLRTRPRELQIRFLALLPQTRPSTVTMVESGPLSGTRPHQ